MKRMIPNNEWDEMVKLLKKTADLVSDLPEIPSPEAEDVGKVLGVNEDGEYTLQEQSGGLPDVTIDDNGKVLGVESGAWNPMSLVGKYVRIMNAPSSTTLTDEEKQKIIGGSFIDGNFLNLYNPIFFPPAEYNNQYWGMAIGTDRTTALSGIYEYSIGSDNNILLRYKYIEFSSSENLLKIKNKLSPKVEIELTNLGTITTTPVGTGFYKNIIPYTDGIANEDIINVKMSNGGVYPCINDTTNSQLVIFNGVDFATDAISVSKCWKIAY